MTRDKLLFCLLFLISVGLFALSTVVMYPVEMFSRPVSLGDIIAIFGYLYLIYGLINFLFAGKEMTVGTYRSAVPSIRRATLLCSISCLISGIIRFGYALIKEPKGVTLLWSLVTVLSALPVGIIMMLEKKTSYIVIRKEDN